MNRVNRTRFYIASHRPDKILEALNSEVDSVIFDLEDLVPKAEKDASWLLTKYALEHADFGDKEIMIRVNNYETPYTARDLQLINNRVTTILYPKAESPDQILRLDEEIGQMEAVLGLPAGGIGIHPAIESALGLINAFDIAKSSKRITAISIGASDFVKDLKTIKSGTGIEALYAKSHLVVAARAAGVKVLDTVYPELDEAGLIRETEETFTLGFDGKGVIRAEQVQIIHEIYARIKNR